MKNATQSLKVTKLAGRTYIELWRSYEWAGRVRTYKIIAGCGWTTDEALDDLSAILA